MKQTKFCPIEIVDYKNRVIGIMKIFLIVKIFFIFLILFPLYSQAKSERGYIDLYEDQQPDFITIRTWVLKTTQNANLGFSSDAIDCLLMNESGYRPFAENLNKNETRDVGIWMINDIHGLSDEVRYNYKSSTYWAINKIKHDKNLGAWYGHNKCK